jgi:hypothetical protein
MHPGIHAPPGAVCYLGGTDEGNVEAIVKALAMDAERDHLIVEVVPSKVSSMAFLRRNVSCKSSAK